MPSAKLPARRHRLSVRLLVLFLATGLALILVIAGSFRGALREQYQQALQPHQNLYVEYIKKDIGLPPDLDAARELAQTLGLEIFIAGPDLSWSSTGQLIDPGAIEIYRRRTAGHSLLEFGEYGHRRFIVRVSSGAYRITFLTEGSRRDHRGGWRLLGMIFLALLVLFACYQLLRWLLRPIEVLDAGVRQIGAGDLNHRIVIDRVDELGSLAHSINTMADELQQMLEAKRQLLLAISHELRSPLTRLKVSAALLEDHSQLSNIHRDIAEMERLISELLEAERLNMRHSVLQLEDVDLAELVPELVCEEFRDGLIRVELPAEARRVMLDPVRIKLLLRNLASNALRHNNADNGPVLLGVEQTAANTLFRVQDFGEGMTAAQIRHVTEPFWRPDASRQRTTGGTGLGLYLCLKIAEAHGGSLDVRSAPGQGTSVVVELPV